MSVISPATNVITPTENRQMRMTPPRISISVMILFGQFFNDSPDQVLHVFAILIDLSQLILGSITPVSACLLNE